MDYKTILVLCDSSEAAAPRIELARHLAQRHGSHLIGLHIRPPFEAPTLRGAGFAAAAHFSAYEERTRAGLEKSRQTFHGITGQAGLKTEWVVARGVVGGFATTEALALARCADLVVLGQPGPDRPADGVPADLPEAVTLWSGRPTLVVPYAGRPAWPIKTAVVCWNASREAARAAADALPLLREAGKVIVLTMDERSSSGAADGDPAADAASWLARQGVKAAARREELAGDGDVGRKILSCAAEIGADLVVMGAYGRSRMRELALGGVTRTVFRFMTVPVLMAH